MSKYLTKVHEIYRADTETEATMLIQEAKKDKTFTLDKYNCEHKERKAKGEVIDNYYRVTLIKSFDDEKEPCNSVQIAYLSADLADEPEEEKEEVVFHATF